jgi:hypothetical protein
MLNSMLNDRFGVASAYTPSHGMGPVSPVIIAITTVGP